MHVKLCLTLFNACLYGSCLCNELVILQAAASWSEIINDPGIDAVVIGTWPYTHHTLVLAALAANKHVLTEARMVSHMQQCCCQCVYRECAVNDAHKDHVVADCS